MLVLEEISHDQGTILLEEIGLGNYLTVVCIQSKVVMSGT